MIRHRAALVFGLVLLAALAPGCKRTGTDVGSPLGPSTLVLTFALEARPNVLLASTSRPISVLQATAEMNGQPVANRPVYFTILTGPGEFGDFSHRTVVTTNSQGVATVMYIGPTKFEIDGDSDVLIEGRLETSTPEAVAKYVDLRVMIAE